MTIKEHYKEAEYHMSKACNGFSTDTVPSTHAHLIQAATHLARVRDSMEELTYNQWLAKYFGVREFQADLKLGG